MSTPLEAQDFCAAAQRRKRNAVETQAPAADRACTVFMCTIMRARIADAADLQEVRTSANAGANR
jgi:hypothetical protein